MSTFNLYSPNTIIYKYHRIKLCDCFFCGINIRAWYFVYFVFSCDRNDYRIPPRFYTLLEFFFVIIIILCWSTYYVVMCILIKWQTVKAVSKRFFFFTFLLVALLVMLKGSFHWYLDMLFLLNLLLLLLR